jgi:hypothetical protein
MEKVLFLERLQRERDKFELLLNHVGFARCLTMRGVVGNLSVKDLLADILAREEFIADRMGEILHGETHIPCKTQAALEAFRNEFGYSDYDSPLLINSQPDDWMMNKHRNIPLNEIVANEIQAYLGIVATLERMPREKINQHNLLNRAADQTYFQYRHHAMNIRHWLKSIAVNTK